MKIEVFTLAYNEEKILPLFLEYYSKFCDSITVFDNNSTDNTSNILKNFKKCNVFHQKYDSGDTLNDSIYLDIKNNCWKNSNSDYVIVVDCDEFLYSPDVKDFIGKNKHPIYKPNGFDMVSKVFPETNNILDIRGGVPSINYSKLCIFDPSVIGEINYQLGCHQAFPTDKNGTPMSVLSSPELKLLHYKNLSLEYRLSKHKAYANRMSEFNKIKGAGVHYLYDEERQTKEFNDILSNSRIII